MPVHELACSHHVLPVWRFDVQFCNVARKLVKVDLLQPALCIFFAAAVHPAPCANSVQGDFCAQKYRTRPHRRLTCGKGFGAITTEKSPRKVNSFFLLPLVCFAAQSWACFCNDKASSITNRTCYSFRSQPQNRLQHVHHSVNLIDAIFNLLQAFCHFAVGKLCRPRPLARPFQVVLQPG